MRRPALDRPRIVTRGDGFDIPAELVLTREQRRKAWEQSPPTAMPVFRELPRPTDPETLRFLEEEAQRRQREKERKVARLRRIVPKEDRTGKRWDPARCRWVPDEFTTRGTRIVHGRGGPGRTAMSAPTAEGETKVAKKAAKKKVAAKKKGAVKKAEGGASAARVIRIKVTGTGPYKDGSAGREHFDAAKGGVTVGEYLDKFKNRKNASQWLGNMIRAGHAELLG